VITSGALRRSISAAFGGGDPHSAGPDNEFFHIEIEILRSAQRVA